MPSLSERKEDILELAGYFLTKLNLEYKTVKGFPKEVKTVLKIIHGLEISEN